MENSMTTPAQRKLHPLILAATVSLTIFSLLGSVALAGLLRCNCTGSSSDHVRSSTTYSIKSYRAESSGRRITLSTPRAYAVDDPVRVANGRTFLI